MLLSEFPDIVFSSWYETMPQDYTDQASFINGAACFETDKTPHTVLDILQGIEWRCGRKRLQNQWKGPRTLDLDILLFDELKLNDSRLTIPHPALHMRQFALAPIVELNQDLRDPVSGQTLLNVLNELPDQGVYKLTGKDYNSLLTQ